MDIQKIKDNIKFFFTIDREGKFDLADLSKVWQRFWSFMQIVLKTFNNFAVQRQGLKAVALSYFGLLAFVPMLAFIFAVTDGLGLADATQWQEMLSRVAILADKPEMIEWIVNFATNIVEQAQSGGVGLVSFLLFLWTVIWLFFQIERVFNDVWRTDNKRDRSIVVRFSWFIGMMIMTPFILIMFSAALVIRTNMLKFMDIDLGELSTLFSWIILIVFGALTLSLMFKFIPEVRVKYRYALSSAFITSLVFSAFQYLYMETQMFVTRLNGVYGVMAAIPLFLIWMNFSWQIVLYGANLTKAVQDFREGEAFAFTETPHKHRKRIMKFYRKAMKARKKEEKEIK